MTIIIGVITVFIGRKTEIRILEREYERDGSSFVILYGRRRIGKTTLIKQFMQEKTLSIFFLPRRKRAESPILSIAFL